MISLDKNILNKNFAAARRMIEYGNDTPQFIVLPHDKKKSVSLSDHVHVHTTGGNKFQQLWRLLRLSKKIIKKETMVQEFRILNHRFSGARAGGGAASAGHGDGWSITAQDPFFTGLVGWRLSRRYQLPLEIQLHGDFYSTNYYKKSGLKHLFYYHIGKFVLRRADVVRAVGERVRQSIIALGISPEKISVRPVAVDAAAIARYAPRINLHHKYPGYSKIFLALGRLDPVKNISWLIEVFKNISADKLLLIAGDGSEREKLEKLACSLPNVRLEGWTDDPCSYIKTADAILFPSLSEGYGLVPIEAAAAGTPVIMNDAGVANYELKPGPNVKIIFVADRQAWVDAIRNL